MECNVIGKKKQVQEPFFESCVVLITLIIVLVLASVALFSTGVTFVVEVDVVFKVELTVVVGMFYISVVDLLENSIGNSSFVCDITFNYITHNNFNSTIEKGNFKKMLL